MGSASVTSLKDSAHRCGGIILEKSRVGLQPWAPAVLLCSGGNLTHTNHKYSFSENHSLRMRFLVFWKEQIDSEGLLTLISSGT